MQIGKLKEGEWLYLGKAYRVRGGKASEVMGLLRNLRDQQEKPSAPAWVLRQMQDEFNQKTSDAALVSVSALLEVPQKTKIPQLRLRITPDEKDKKGETLTITAEDTDSAAIGKGALPKSACDAVRGLCNRLGLAFAEDDDFLLEFAIHVFRNSEKYGLTEEDDYRGPLIIE